MENLIAVYTKLKPSCTTTWACYALSNMDTPTKSSVYLKFLILFNFDSVEFDSPQPVSEPVFHQSGSVSGRAR